MFYIQRVALRKAVCTFSITIAIKKKDFIVKIHIIPYTVDSIWNGEKSSCTLLFDLLCSSNKNCLNKVLNRPKI